jgi:hypothetical protein
MRTPSESKLLIRSALKGLLLRPQFDVAVQGGHLGVRVHAQEVPPAPVDANLSLAPLARVDGTRRAP